MGAIFFKEEQKLKKENRLLTIDGETLMSQPLTPLNFVVDIPTLISLLMAAAVLLLLWWGLGTVWSSSSLLSL